MPSPDYALTARFGLRCLKGDSLINDIDEGFKALGDDVDAFMVAKVAVTIGDGAATSFAIAHNLNSLDVTVAVREVAVPHGEVVAEIQHTDVNTVTVIFTSAPAVNAYRVIVIG
jgi:ABC-type thiamine transport system ATPase subunit